MAINTLEFKTKLAEQLDKKLVQNAVTSFLEDASMKAHFVGAKTVLLPDIEYVGLGNYNRDTGFPKGGVTVSHTSYTLTMDRGRTFSIDREDMDEMGIANLAGQVMGEFVRTEVAPETDAFSLSKIAKVATDKSHTATVSAIDTEALKLLTQLTNSVQDVMGYTGEMVAFLDPTVYAALMSTPELTRILNVGEFTRGGVSTKVKMFNDCALIPVQGARMKTEYTFDAGSGTSAGGFTPGGSAQNIGAIVMPKNGASIIKKSEKIRVFEPDDNQEMDAYKFDYRIYYDTLVKKSMQDAIFAYTYTAG